MGKGGIRVPNEVNIYEIAREAGVSIATVSRVINNSSSVSEKKRRQVMEVVNRHNYVPSSAAKMLSTSSSNLVGVVIPDINNPFFAQVLQGINQESDNHHCHIFLCHTDETAERELQVLQALRQYSLQGIIIAPVLENNTETLNLLKGYENRGVPVIQLDRVLDGADFDSVITDDIQGSRDAVKALISAGHTRIATITGPATSRPGRDRYEGYRLAMEEAGLPLRQEYIRRGDFRMEQAYEQAKALCAMPDPPTAIYSCNNLTTFGCLKAFQELGLTIGKDIAILGFDEVEPLNWINFGLSVVDRDAREMGRQAMTLLTRHIEERDGRNNPEREGCVCLPTELIIRGSERLPG